MVELVGFGDQVGEHFEVLDLVVGGLIAEAFEDQVVAVDASADVVRAGPVFGVDEPFDACGEDLHRPDRPVGFVEVVAEFGERPFWFDAADGGELFATACGVVPCAQCQRVALRVRVDDL